MRSRDRSPGCGHAGRSGVTSARRQRPGPRRFGTARAETAGGLNRVAPDRDEQDDGDRQAEQGTPREHRRWAMVARRTTRASTGAATLSAELAHDRQASSVRDARTMADVTDRPALGLADDQPHDSLPLLGGLSPTAPGLLGLVGGRAGNGTNPRPQVLEDKREAERGDHHREEDDDRNGESAALRERGVFDRLDELEPNSLPRWDLVRRLLSLDICAERVNSSSGNDKRTARSFDKPVTVTNGRLPSRPLIGSRTTAALKAPGSGSPSRASRFTGSLFAIVE